jgi:hypothetical protein
MAANDSVRKLIDGIIACDEQPAEDRMSELRKSLQHKVETMKRRARFSQYLCAAAVFLFGLGYIIVAIAAREHQTIRWLAVTGFSVVILGAVLAVAGAVGLFAYRGFGFVWARHDLHDAAIMELSLQVERLSHRVDRIDGES